MDITFCTLEDVHLKGGVVVVIDVLRAFTTSAVALAQGAGPYRLVATLEEAYAARDADPSVQLLGEVDGLKAAGFDHSNSPTELEGIDLTGIPIVHRSSAGTQGVVRATGAERILTTSFAVAAATAAALRAQPRISFCVTGLHGVRDGEEDRACGEYIAALLRTDGDRTIDPEPYLARVRASSAAGLFGSDGLPLEDVAFASVLDRFSFAMQVERSDQGHLLTAIEVG